MRGNNNAENSNTEETKNNGDKSTSTKADNISGHTATVATPIKQGNSINDKLMQVYKIPMQIDYQSKPELVNELTKNSKSQIKITNVFAFKNIKVNGISIQTSKSYCFYI